MCHDLSRIYIACLLVAVAVGSSMHTPVILICGCIYYICVMKQLRLLSSPASPQEFYLYIRNYEIWETLGIN